MFRKYCIKRHTKGRAVKEVELCERETHASPGQPHEKVAALARFARAFAASDPLVVGRFTFVGR